MSRTPFLFLAGLAISTLSCTENQPPKTEAPPAQQRPSFLQSLQQGQVSYSGNLGTSQTGRGAGPDLSTMGVSSNAPTGPVAKETAPTMPSDARWTLVCSTMQGPDRFARMQQFVTFLRANTPLKEWYTVDQDGSITLFHGFYSDIRVSSAEKASADALRAHEDRRKLVEWKNAAGERPFATATFTPVIAPDPAAPAEWNLANAPAKSYWSLQIAAFKDNSKRKEAAVEAVKELRDKGVEAFYYHGATVSSVCIGAWPQNALREQEFDGSTATYFNEEDAILVSNSNLPPGIKQRNLRDPQGNKVQALTQQIDVVDKSLLAAMKEYPHHLVNYEPVGKQVRGADNKTKIVPAPSFLVKIPHPEASGLGGAAGGDFMRQPAPTNRQPGTGTLRGIGN